MRFYAILILCICLCLSHNAVSQTSVSGNVEGIWEASGNPYLVVGDVVVPSSHFLTITAGVEVRFTGDFSITVQGGMCAYGTVEDSVRFIAHIGQTPGLWKYIKYDHAWGDSTNLRYCHIESGERAVWANVCHITIDNSLIKNHELSPIRGQDATITMALCTVTNSGGSGITLDNSSLNLLECNISYHAGGSGNGIYASGPGTIEISGGFIGHNSGSGIDGFQITGCYLNDVEIANNSFKGINLVQAGQLGVSGCLIHDNENHGIFLNSTTLTAYQLTVSSNAGYGVFSFGGSMQISSSIVDRNESWGFFSQSSPSNLQYNDAYLNAAGDYSGCAAGTGSISENPQYLSYTNRDFHLQESSPCIDAGSPDDPLDPDGTRADMGALYFHQNPIEPRGSVPPASSFRIMAAYPNPFNPALTLHIQAVQPSPAIVQAWSVNGGFAALIWRGNLHPGSNYIVWSAVDLPSGNYIVRLLAGSESDARLCTLVK
jgi:hypothetical protein